MPRFFTTNIDGKTAFIEGDDARHIAKSLRMRVGDELTLCDMRGSDYSCKITAIDKDRVVAEALGRWPTAAEPRFELTLYQALPKADKLEHIAQKAVELGGAALVPVHSSYCVARWPEKDEAKKRERLDRIMLEAAKQSGRGRIPRTEPLLGFKEAVLRMKEADLAIMFYEGAKTPLREILAKAGKNLRSVAVMIGSEGGFSPEEAAFAEESGVPLASLGARILRCETAPVCAISAINYALGEF
jgi:16S rRNA (uracil1498-N3)-methyltransferase